MMKVMMINDTADDDDYDDDMAIRIGGWWEGEGEGW
jgi:hypothetical protein